MNSIWYWLIGRAGEVPRAASLDGRTDVIALQVVSDTLLALSFFALAFSIAYFSRCRSDLLPKQQRLARLFGGFVFLCGIALLVEVMSFWFPVHGLSGLFTAATAVMAAATLAVLWPQLPDFVRPPPSVANEENTQKLRREVAAHESTLRELEGSQRDLETRVTDRTKELSLVKARFETALRGAQVYLFSQDPELNYNWTYSPRKDALLPTSDSDSIVALKRKVLQTGTPQDAETSYALPEGRVLFSVHIDPTYDAHGKIDGIMSAAIDVTRIRSLESEQQRLTSELATALQRYETALRGSNVTVFTQDRELRYTSISNPILGREMHEIIGHTDDDVIPAESRPAIDAIKGEALTSGVAKGGEVRVHFRGSVRWLDLHIEPLRDVEGSLIGLTGAAVDITDRKEGEAHLRLLMRELTHRSKNLLAVIQAMARQTARHSGTIESFLDHFSARLQGLARSHDLLVQEGWHGASLLELIRTQLGHYLDQAQPQISVEGPAILLRPEAAQSLGLALHELATNAAKYGALSGPDGRVSITWTRRAAEEGAGVEIIWNEKGGPDVAQPTNRGFGTLVIERNLSQSLDAEVELSFEPGGVRCRIVVPLAQLYSTQ